MFAGKPIAESLSIQPGVKIDETGKVEMRIEDVKLRLIKRMTMCRFCEQVEIGRVSVVDIWENGNVVGISCQSLPILRRSCE